MEDVVRSLGHLALGTRMKRIGERLQAETQELIVAAGIDVPVVQWTVLAALDRQGELSVGELAEALGVRQPGVTRTVGKMEADGLVRAASSRGDRRVKRVGLTDEGEALVARGKAELWPRIEAAVADACAGLSGSLLDQLSGLEDALQRAPLARRGGPRASA